MSQSDPGEGLSPRAHFVETAPHPDPLPAKCGEREKNMGGFMSRIAIASAAAVLMSATLANAAESIALRDMGSFHVGGRLVEISGKPVKEVTFTPGGVPA